MDLIKRTLESIPDFERFPTLEELDASTQRLAAEYPDLVTVTTVGHSTKGHPIQMLRIGKGEKRALFVGLPHPNEPIGVPTLEYLSRRLCEDALLREEFGYTFYIIKAIDPDGYRLNEGWLAGPYSLERYIRNYYRPAVPEQPEWTFPYEYKSYKYDRPIPETLAFMAAIDQAQPHFLNSLHNVDMGGTYFYITEPLPEEIYNQFYELATEHGLPLMSGEPEFPFMPFLRDAIFLLPRQSQVYDFHESTVGATTDPASLMTAGASSFDYSYARYGTLGLVSEVSLFFDPRMDDKRPTETERRAAVLTSLERIADRYRFLKEQYNRALPFVQVDTPFQRSVENFMKNSERSIPSTRKWAETHPDLQRPATEAELLDSRTRNFFWQLCTHAMLVQMMDAQPAMDELVAIRQETADRLEELIAELLTMLNWSKRPLRELTAVQLGSALTMMAALRDGLSRTKTEG